MGMVSECCCKEVYIIIIIIDILIIINTFPYSTCINSFFGSIIPISLFILKCFFCTLYIYTHRESLVRNHEPYAKALGNYTLELQRFK